MGNVVFTAFSLLASFLVLVPLPWQLEAWNVGTCLYMLWASLSCFNYGVNSIIWRSDAINRAPVWCDICEYKRSIKYSSSFDLVDLFIQHLGSS